MILSVLSRPMERLKHIRVTTAAYCLAELLLVLVLLSMCAAAGAVFAFQGLAKGEARGNAQSWQAAAAWAQLGVIWHGGHTRVHLAHDQLLLEHDIGSCGGDLGASAPDGSASTNVARWQATDGIDVMFGGLLASPDSGGSLYWVTGGGSYRISVRPESGLSIRTWTPR